ncbi:hypothetical protein ACOMHN_037800 [Nucella lapillus]
MYKCNIPQTAVFEGLRIKAQDDTALPSSHRTHPHRGPADSVIGQIVPQESEACRFQESNRLQRLKV